MRGGSKTEGTDEILCAPYATILATKLNIKTVAFMDMVVIVPDVNDENNWSFMENTITMTLTGISQRRRQWWFRRRLSTLTGGMVWWADARHSGKVVPRQGNWRDLVRALCDTPGNEVRK